MIPSRIFSNRGIIRSKAAWFLVVLGVVTVLVMVRWPKEAKKASIKTESVERVKAESVEEPQEGVLAEVPVAEQKTLQEDLLPEKRLPEEPEKVEMDIVKTLQGVVTNNDSCIQLLSVEGFDFDTGPVDVTGIRAGDVVKARYIEKNLGRRKTNILKSVELIAASRQSIAQSFIPEEEAFRAAAEPEENEGYMEEAPLPEPREWPLTRPSAGEGPSMGSHKQGGWPKSAEEVLADREQMSKSAELAQEDMLDEPEALEDEPEALETDMSVTMEGRVIAYDHCFQLITVEGLHFDGGRLDLSGIEPGDHVKITYTERQNGNVLDSIEVIEKNY
jgi:hypothetical protein